jgi:uncharacterized protein YhdP
MSPRLRTTIIVSVVVASFVAALAVAYEMAVARVPRQRAAFESLVRAQTGLDVRFNELAFRMGWYGPEAVFRRVELGEPGRSNVLLRAPQLVVAINAWQTMRSGQLVAGRITLIAPDIDLEKMGQAPPADAAATRASGGVPRASRTDVLERWKGGVIDLQGGTVKVTDPAGGAGPLTLQIRRAALKRAGNEWSGHALVFLPERLGRTARVVFQLKGDIRAPGALSGGIRFEGVRLSFSSWRGALGAMPRLAGYLPQLGTGDVTFDLTLKNGIVEKADGEVRAADLLVGAPDWLESLRASRGALKLDYVTGSWRFLRRGETSQLQIEQLVLGREQRDSPLPQFTIEMTPGHLTTKLPSAPLGAITALGRWIAPELAPADVALDGKMEAIDVDWNEARPQGFRLAASAQVEEVKATSVTRGFTLDAVPVRLRATESELALEIDAHAAQLQLAADPEHPMEALKLVSRVLVTREGSGWRVAIPRFEFKDESAEGEMSGSIVTAASEREPLIDVRGTVAHADIGRLQVRFAGGVTQVYGAAGLRVGAGRIEDGAFEFRGRPDALDAARFVGSFNVRNARIPSDGTWPDTEGVDANVEWNGPHVSASVNKGQTGDFELESVEAQWDASGVQPARFTGRAQGRLESALALMRSSPDLQKQAPHLQELAASGDALFDFDISVPSAAALTPAGSPQLSTRISTVLEGVQFRLALDLPPVEALRGAVTYDSGRLQRSTLSATWLGGPLTLKIAERRDRRGSALTVQAQGFVDAGKLVALSQIKPFSEVSGETAWSGEFAYTPPNDAAPARWVGRADSALIGVVSDLPAPLAKSASATLPLHIEISGTGNTSELRANLADRLRAALALDVVNGEDWKIDRAAIRLGGGPATLPDDKVIQVRGHVRRIDAPAYAVAWQKLRSAAPDAHPDIDISSDELTFGDRVHDDAHVLVSATAGNPAASALRIEAPSFGVLTGTLLPESKALAFNDIHLRRHALMGTGNLRCGDDLASCRAAFEVESTDVAASLADFGFRPDLSAARGALSGEIVWRPRQGTPWLESAAGTLSMRFEDGIAHRPDPGSPVRPLGLLTVPALLGGISRHAAAAAPSAPDIDEPGELKFTRLDAHFQLRDGQATTSDLHFDGDAEILVRGRMGLLAGDYDHEAWVLRGEERLPLSMRRLASVPRVAAAWLTLRELIGGDPTSRSRIVLRMRGSWDEPIVTVE